MPLWIKRVFLQVRTRMRFGFLWPKDFFPVSTGGTNQLIRVMWHTTVAEPLNKINVEQALF